MWLSATSHGIAVNNLGILIIFVITPNNQATVQWGHKAMSKMPFKIKHASSVPVSVVIDTEVNTN